MNAILGTLPFIATLWLLVVLSAVVLEESGAKIVAALKGKSLQQSRPVSARARSRSNLHLPRRASVEWRVAA